MLSVLTTLLLLWAKSQKQISNAMFRAFDGRHVWWSYEPAQSGGKGGNVYPNMMM